MSYTDRLNTDQWFDLVIILSSMVLVFALWKTKLCLPFKLLTVFIHELGHATTALLCCGKVTSITVQENEGGLTNFTYKKECVRFWVTPAGYIGSSIVGAALLISSAKVLGSLIASGVLAAVILFSLIYQKNFIPRLLTAGYVSIVVLLFILYFAKVDDRAIGLRIFCLFQGVMNGLYSVWDIWDDTVSRVVRDSDASHCATLCGCPGSSRLVGITWMIFSFCVFVLAVIVHLYIAAP
jgi:FtsH-binding integral membrane protein